MKRIVQHVISLAVRTGELWGRAQDSNFAFLLGFGNIIIILIPLCFPFLCIRFSHWLGTLVAWVLLLAGAVFHLRRNYWEFLAAFFEPLIDHSLTVFVLIVALLAYTIPSTVWSGADYKLHCGQTARNVLFSGSATYDAHAGVVRVRSSSKEVEIVPVGPPKAIGVSLFLGRVIGIRTHHGGPFSEPKRGVITGYSASSGAMINIRTPETGYHHAPLVVPW